MKTPPPDGASRDGESVEEDLHAGEIDARTTATEAPELALLLQLRDAFARDLVEVEAALSVVVETPARLYERLLRVRRISLKLDNRIQVVRLQQQLRVG